MYGRGDSTSFIAGNVGTSAPGSGGGYEIVSFNATPISSGVGTYVYGGADLPAAHGGPMQPIISCSASFTAFEMNLEVTGAYPYAGCVFFLGVSNTGDRAFRVSLGSLGDDAEVTCNVEGCEASDIDIVGGGATAAEVAALCHASGGTVEALGAGLYSVPPGVTYVCPLFVTVLQPAQEGATYVVSITPPPPETPPQILDVPEEPRPLLNDQPPSIPSESPTTAPTATATPTPVAIEEGERTPGPAVTPLPPQTGTGLVIRRSHDTGYALLSGLLFAGSAIAAVIAFRRPLGAN